MQRVRFIGLGAMGAVSVPRLLQAGYAVVGWNRTESKARPLREAGMACAGRGAGPGGRAGGPAPLHRAQRQRLRHEAGSEPAAHGGGDHLRRGGGASREGGRRPCGGGG
ncbi:MAG: hypothetical protein C4303_09600, partial [candidate division GAL15 bacterium]